MNSLSMETDVFAIEPRCNDRRNEELRAVGVRASIGHRQETGFGVFQLEVFIGKFLTIDTRTTLDQHESCIRTRLLPFTTGTIAVKREEEQMRCRSS